jgi:hypothetical protein
MRRWNNKTIFAIFVIFCFLISAYGSLAYEMGSDSYRIQESSINVGGQDIQTSTSYQLRESIGEPVAGTATSTSYRLKMGYQPMLEIYIAISVSPSQVAMSPNIGGMTGGQSNGSTTAIVTTDSPAGYTLSVKANASPALATSSYSFADYTPAVAGTPDYTWSILATTSEFGFTPEGSHIVSKFLDNGSNTCTTGSASTSDACWYGFSTSTETIASSDSSNHPAGTQTIVKFRAESGNQNVQPPGEYHATIITTAIAN